MNDADPDVKTVRVTLVLFYSIKCITFLKLFVIINNELICIYCRDFQLSKPINRSLISCHAKTVLNKGKDARFNNDIVNSKKCMSSLSRETKARI